MSTSHNEMCVTENRVPMSMLMISRSGMVVSTNLRIRRREIVDGRVVLPGDPHTKALGASRVDFGSRLTTS